MNDQISQKLSGLSASFYLIGIGSILFTGCEYNSQKMKGDGMQSELYQSVSDLKSKIQSYIDRSEAVVAVSFKCSEHKLYLGINDTITMHAASTMKVPVMMEIFRQSNQGLFALEDSIEIKNQFKSIIDTSIYSLDKSEDSNIRLYSLLGSKESIRVLVNEMITSSSNLATNLLLELVSAEKVQNFMETLGARDIYVLRGVEDIKAYRAGRNNTTTARDLAIIFQAILDGREWREESQVEMINILLDQKHKKKIPAGLPSEVKIAHKTGSITEIDHDCGIIYPPGRNPYILVVLTQGFKSHENAQKCIAEISALVYQWYDRNVESGSIRKI
jgi:beta-lactamase class A